MQPCNHARTEILARRDGVDYVRCLDCDQVFEAEDLEAIDALLRTVSDSARCNLAYQQHDVVDSILGLFEDSFRDHVNDEQLPAEPELIAPIVDIVDGRAVLDEHQRDKQPDWTYDAEYSGKTPADRLDDHRAHEQL